MRADMYLSYSQISTYMACPLKYKFHYMDTVEPEFTPVSLAFGAAIHEAVATYYQNRLEGNNLSPSEMLGVYRHEWRKQENIRFFNGDNESSLCIKAEQLLSVFHASIDPTTTILGVEERFDMPMENMPSFLGFIDLIEQDSAGNITIVDLKTASKKPTDTNVHQNLQLTAYSLGARALGFNGPETKCRLDVLTKTKAPSCSPMRLCGRKRTATGLSLLLREYGEESSKAYGSRSTIGTVSSAPIKPIATNGNRRK
jgi:putative RecB family exonuclease